MQGSPEGIDTDDEQLAFLDEIASLSQAANENFDELRERYLKDDLIRVPNLIMSRDPITHRKLKITLKGL